MAITKNKTTSLSAVLFALLAVTLICSTARANDLETVFHNPPESAKPWVFWYWMRANATAEGITRDLQAMAETGIGGAILMPIGHGGESTIADPPANPLSEHFWKLVIHATKEADRLGMGLEMNACDGWALAGGPWITPDMSMQEVVITEQVIEGGKTFKGKLLQPKSRNNYYRDIAVLAFPEPLGTAVTSTQLEPKATTNIKGLNPQLLVKGHEKLVRFSSWGWIQFQFDKPFTCRSIRISPDIKMCYQVNRAEILVSDDGKKFRSIGRLKPPQFHGWQDTGMSATYSIELATAKFFRFVIDPSGTRPAFESHEGSKARHRIRMSAQHIELSSRPRINHFQGKAGYRWRRSDWTTDKQCPPELCVPLDSIVNLTGKMKPDGTLNWTPPNGRWTVQRIGYTTTGVCNRPAGTGVGLECDKFSPAAAKLQFDSWFGEALKRVGPKLAGKTLRRNHTDSWEAFSQNWSPLFREEFIKRRGYDPVPWLPVMTGVPVGSAEISERFLYDIRRTINDLVCENFFGSMIKLGRKHGTGFSAECIAPTMMADGLELFKYADIPMGEFWLNSVNQDKPNDVMDAICGGHIYGKRIIGAEAFTQNPLHWNEDPYYLKPLGDYNFAKGINKFILHVWAHQAFDKKPGVTLNRVGTFFGGTQTWHKPGKAWFDYIRRCSAMLQQGIPVADVCYFIGEEQPSRSYLRQHLPVPLPDGYAYDCINRDALLTRAKAKNGQIVLPDGVSYRMLVLPPSDRMTPEVVQKIGELAKAGVPVIGSNPTRSISLHDYPKCDDNVRKIVSRSWKSVRSTTTAQAVFKELDLLPDVEFIGVDLTPVYNEKMQYHAPPFAWNHRKTKDADIYFLSNQKRQWRRVDVAFRCTGRVPELWNPVTGKITDAGSWYRNGRTMVSVNFAPAGSVFIVFRRNEAQTLKRQPAHTQYISIKDMSVTQAITGPWTVTFSPDTGAPARIKMPKLHSLSEHRNQDVKHFSGTAKYSAAFDVANVRNSKRLFLDLGKVANLAEVTVNGKNLGILWKPSFSVEVTDVIKPGKNTLEIDVTNTWLNRMIGDASLPKKDRITWLLFKDVYPDPDTPLEPAGLIGPVMLKTVRGVIIK